MTTFCLLWGQSRTKQLKKRKKRFFMNGSSSKIKFWTRQRPGTTDFWNRCILIYMYVHKSKTGGKFWIKNSISRRGRFTIFAVTFWWHLWHVYFLYIYIYGMCTWVSHHKNWGQRENPESLRPWWPSPASPRGSAAQTSYPCPTNRRTRT